MWWKDLFVPTISGLIVAGLSVLWAIGNQRKKNEAIFKKQIRLLKGELESNLQGRGTPEVPFQSHWLQIILQSDIFHEKYPSLFEKAAHCENLARGQKGIKPAHVQFHMRELKELIEKNIVDQQPKKR